MESWKKTLYISLVIVFFQSVGMSMFLPFLPLFIKELGITDPKAQSVWSGILFGVSYLSLALMSPLWGSLGDKYGRKPLILRTTFGVTLIAFMMSLATNIYQLFVLRILQGVCGGLMPVLIALVSYRLPKEKTGQGLGTMQTALLAGTIVGPFIGGLLSDWIGYRNVLLVIASSTFIAGIITIVFIHETKREPTKVPGTILNNIKLVIASHDLRIVAIVMFATQFSLFIVQPILPLFIVSLHSSSNSATMVGLVFSVTGFSTMLFARYKGKAGDTKGHRNVLLQSLLFTGIAYLPQAFVTSAYQLLPLRAVIGFFIAGIIPSTQSMIVKNTKDSQRGGVLGITHSANIFGQALGPLIGGSLGAVFGYRITFALTAILLMAISCGVKSYLHKSEAVA